MSTANNNIPLVPENTIDPAAGLNESLNVIDALLQCRVLTVGTNAPPVTPASGSRFIVGTAPTGAWGGRAGKLARWLDGRWSFFDAAIVVNLDDNTLYIRGSAGWIAVS